MQIILHEDIFLIVQSNACAIICGQPNGLKLHCSSLYTVRSLKVFHFNKNEIWTPQKPASLMTCLHRKRQFLFNGDYYWEQIKLPGPYELEIMGKEKKLHFVCGCTHSRMCLWACIAMLQNGVLKNAGLLQIACFLKGRQHNHICVLMLVG